MATSVKNDVEMFLVKSAGAVDLANHTAVASVDTAIDVVNMDGTDHPLLTTDKALLIAGFVALEAGVAAVCSTVTDDNTITLRTTNPSAGAINPASIAAGSLIWLIARRG